MLHQLRRAIEPELTLDQVLEDWENISESLAERPRRRGRQLNQHQFERKTS
jgi:hypothetical protein